MDSSRKQRWLIIGLLISNAVLITFLILGNPSFRKHSSPRKMVIERLEFNSTQVDDYQQLIDKHRNEVNDVDVQINELRLKLYKGLNAHSKSTESMMLGQLSILQTEAEQLKLDHFREIKGICTPEQVGKFEALTEELGKMFSRHSSKKRG